MNIAHVPSSTVVGAHVLRSDTHDTVVLITSFSAEARARAYKMLRRDERARLVEQLGSAVHLLSWLDDDMTAEQTPRALRLAGWLYETRDIIAPPSFDTPMLPERRVSARRRSAPTEPTRHHGRRSA